MQLLVAALFAGGLLQFLTGSMAHVVIEESASAPPVAAGKQSAIHSPRAVPLPSSSGRVLLELGQRVADAAQASALFAPRSWYSPPPPPPPAAPAPEAAPVSPPLPYTLMGSYTDSDNTTVYFVARDDRVYDVKPGDTLDQTYSVEAVENGQLVFLYKPLNVRQSLPIGAAP